MKKALLDTPLTEHFTEQLLKLYEQKSVTI
jgi:hypothetical protein